MTLDEMGSIWSGTGGPGRGGSGREPGSVQRPRGHALLSSYAPPSEGAVTAVTNFREKYTFVWQQLSLQNRGLLRAYLWCLLCFHIFKLCLVLLSDLSPSNFNSVLCSPPKLFVPPFPHSFHVSLPFFNVCLFVFYNNIRFATTLNFFVQNYRALHFEVLKNRQVMVIKSMQAGKHAEGVLNIPKQQRCSEHRHVITVVTVAPYISISV